MITVYEYGELPFQGPKFYYFDMDLCDMNLEQFMIGKDSFEEFRNIINASSRLILRCEDPKNYGFASTFPYGVRILQQITKGLQYLHGLKFVHRDLKPTNGKTPKW